MEVSPLRFYLIALKPKIVFSGRVASDPSDPYMTIQWNSGATGSTGAPVAGNTAWFGTSSGGKERGTLRLRPWTPSDATGTAGNLSVAESDDVGPDIVANDYITIKQEHRLWPVYPRILQISDTEVVYYEDWDIEFGDQTVDWEPIAVAGPPGVAWLEGGFAQIHFVGDNSFALAPSASITGSLWTAHGSLEVTDAELGTEGSPVTFTWTGTASGQFDGQYPVSLQVTDDNGKAHTTHTWAFVIDPNDPDSTVYTDFDTMSDSIDYEQGGGEASFVVHGGASVADFPEGTMIILACMGDITTATGSWPFRTNVLFVGYIMDGTIRQNPRSGDVRFRAATVDAIMRNLTMWPVSLTDRTGPLDWTMAKDLTLDRACSFLWRYRSTLANMAPIMPSNYSPFIARQDFGPQDLYSSLDDLLRNAWGHVFVNHQGVVYHGLEYQTMLDAEQAGVTTRKTLHKGVWVDDVEIDERADYVWPVNQVKQSGIYYPGSEADVVPLFSEAPGDAPKTYGSEDSLGSFILNTQADLNTRCGRKLAKQVQKYPAVRMRFLNDGAFTVGPQEIFPAIIESGDNDRGLAWSPSLIPRRIRRTYDHRGGYFVSEVEFEPSTTGKAGVTVTMPPTPPPPELPPWDPPPPPPVVPPSLPAPGPAVAADGAMGVYWTLTSGDTWAARNNGLASLRFRDLIWDPWWRNRTGGHDPEQSILWGCGVGFVAKSDDAGKNWGDLTIYLPTPDNDEGDSPAPTVADLTFLQAHGCIHNQDTFYLIAEWYSDTASEWRGWIYKTTTNGLTWTQTQIVVGAGATTSSAYATSITDEGADVTANWKANVGTNPDGAFYNIDEDDDIVITFPFTIPSGTTVYIYSWESPRSLVHGEMFDWDGGAWNQIGNNLGGSPGWQNFNTENNSSLFRLWYEPQIGIDDNWRVDALYWEYAPPGGSRPLWMDIDTENGTRLYLTARIGSELYVQKRLTSDLSVDASYNFGSASEGEVNAKIYWIAPRAAHLPGVVGFGDYVYVYGRYNDGGIAHLAFSNDGIATFSNVGDGGWTTERIGAFDVAMDGLTLLALLNDAAATLHQSGDNGTSWGQINTVPFNVEADAMSRHWGESAELLIGNNTGSTQMAAYVASPYTAAWTDATGPGGARLPTQADGGVGIWSIIWV